MNNRKALYTLEFIFRFADRIAQSSYAMLGIFISCILLFPLCLLFDDRKNALLFLDTVYWCYHLIVFVLLLHALIADTKSFLALKELLDPRSIAGNKFLRAYFQSISKKVRLFYQFLQQQGSSIIRSFLMRFAHTAARHRQTSAGRIIHLSANRRIKRKLKLLNFILGLKGLSRSVWKIIYQAEGSLKILARMNSGTWSGPSGGVRMSELRFSTKGKESDVRSKGMQNMSRTNIRR